MKQTPGGFQLTRKKKKEKNKKSLFLQSLMTDIMWVLHILWRFGALFPNLSGYVNKVKVCMNFNV